MSIHSLPLPPEQLTMKMSDEGRKRLTAREGVRLKAYKDSVGVWTIGIGHTSAAGPPKVTPDLTITREECDAIFKRDLVQYENAVHKAVKVDLAQHQFDACVSLCFNIGVGAFAKSTVVKRIKAGDMAGAAAAFMFWNKPSEIIGRRRTEMVQFQTPYKPAVQRGVVEGANEAGAAHVDEDPAQPVDVPPDLRDIQRRLKAMNYNPGGIDGRWGGMTAGAIGGFINDRDMGISAPTSLAMFRDIEDELAAELDDAEAESFTRPVSIERANADAKKVEQVAPEVVPVKQNFLVQIWAAICAFFAAVANSVSGYVKAAWDFFTDHRDDIPTDSGLLGTAWEFVASMPIAVWFALAGCGIAYVAWNSWRGVRDITKAVQTGVRQ